MRIVVDLELAEGTLPRHREKLMAARRMVLHQRHITRLNSTSPRELQQGEATLPAGLLKPCLATPGDLRQQDAAARAKAISLTRRR